MCGLAEDFHEHFRDRYCYAARLKGTSMVLSAPQASSCVRPSLRSFHVVKVIFLQVRYSYKHYQGEDSTLCLSYQFENEKTYIDVIET